MSTRGSVIFTGSIGLANAEAVFRGLAGSVGSRASRYPDGETQERTMWFTWQGELFQKNPAFELGREVEMDFGGMHFDARPYLKIADGVEPGSIEFEPLGYAKAAVQSYTIFKRLRDEGIVPSETRFQVALPTPLAVLTGLVVVEDGAAVEPAYEAAMLKDLETMIGHIPPQDLAIQWDVCTEILAMDGGPEKLYYDDALTGTLDRIERLSTGIPDAVELGIHLCYGAPGHKHIIEPPDTRSAVLLSNGICQHVRREVNWIHLPVPRGRDDGAYFAPLNDLKLNPETELFLGLIHLTDGVEGAARRSSTARRYVADFGVATECGFGRRDPATISSLLALHAQVADA